MRVLDSEYGGCADGGEAERVEWRVAGAECVQVCARREGREVPGVELSAEGPVVMDWGRSEFLERRGLGWVGNAQSHKG